MKKLLFKSNKKSSYEMIFNIDRFYIYPYYFADISFTSSAKEAIGGNFTRIIVEFSKDHAVSYMNIEEAERLGKKIFARIFGKEKYYKLVEKKILGYGAALMKFCQRINKIRINNLTNPELYGIYHKYGQLITKMRDWGGVPVVLDGMKTPYLSNYLMEQFKKIGGEKKLTAKEISNYYSLLTSSDKKSEVMQEEINRLNLILQIEKKLPAFKNLFKEKDDQELILLIKDKYSQTYRLLKGHAEEFGWLTFYYVGPTMSVYDLIKMIRNDFSSKESIIDQIKKIETHFQKLPAEKVAVIKKLGLPAKLVYLLNVSSFFTYLKDHRKGIYQKSYVAVEPVIEEIAKRINLSVKEAKYLVDYEIKDALLRNKNFRQIASRRTEYCVSHVYKGEMEVLTGNEATRLINKYVFKSTDEPIETNQLKGSVAYAGRVTGVVKIVITKDDVDKVKEGDILVSPATNPDLIIAMKKAAAFVTDRGGIISHAAIISRELKKPCVVGTGIATKVLQDGDLVEVDAEQGVVRKVK